MNQLKHNKQRASLAINIIAAVLFFEIAMLISDFFQYQLIQTVADGGEITDAQAESNDNRQQMLAILYLMLYFTSAITFILWFRRAYYNLHTKINYLNFPEEWASYAWFTPVLNLFRPFKIMKELFTETNLYLSERSKGFTPKENSTVLTIWWALWVITGVFGQIIYRMDGESLDELLTSTFLSMVQEMIGIPLALITMKIIKDYAKLEEQLYEFKEELPK